MKRLHLKITTTLALLLIITSATAQESTQQNIAPDSTAILDKKVAKLENIVSKLPQVSGFIQTMFSWSEDNGESSNYFRIRRARLIFKGSLYKSLINYNFTTDFAGGVKIVDAYMCITPWKQFNIQVGAFRPSFTIENMFYGSLSMEAIDYPQIVKKMTHLGDITGLNSAGRDIGVQIHGGFFNKRGFSTLEYRIGVFNGNGVMVTKDDNKAKDYSAMLGIYPIKNLVFVGSCYCGFWNSGDKTNNLRARWNVGYRYDDGRIFTRGEYIRGKTEGIANSTGDSNMLLSEGAFVMLGARFFKQQFAPFVRAEYYAQDRLNHKGTGEPGFTLGVDYNPLKNIRFQACYTYISRNSGKLPRNTVELLLTGKF